MNLQACSADRLLADLTPAGNYGGEHIGYGVKIEAMEAAVPTAEDRLTAQEEVRKLRTFFLEKLTVKQLRHLVDTIDGANGDGPVVNLRAIDFKERTPRLKRRERASKGPRSSKVYRSSLVPKDILYAISALTISNLAIETPVSATRNMNAVKICAGTSRLLYDTNFMLEEDWCSCVISVHFSHIEAISCNRLEMTLDLKQPAIVEAGYRNGSSTILGEPNVEVENGLRHHLVMRSPSDMVGFKAALVAADPSMVHKFMVAKFNSDPDMQRSYDQRDPCPVLSSDTLAPFYQHMNNGLIGHSGPSQYLVPQLCPNSYGQISSSSVYCLNQGYAAPSMHYDETPFNQGAPAFKYSTEPGTDYRQIFTKLEPLDAHEEGGPVPMYTHESVFHGSQYANTQPEPSVAMNSQYYVQDMQANSDYFVDSPTVWAEGPSNATLAQHYLDESCPRPRESILDIAVLGIGDTGYLEQGTHDGVHPWAGDASHLGYFNTSSA